jgi:hypothetical protein
MQKALAANTYGGGFFSAFMITVVAASVAVRIAAESLFR